MNRISSIAYWSTFAAVCVLGLGAQREVRADDALPAAPQENFLSSLKQAFKQDFDNAVVRGHFDVGTAPDTHRYYCLVDAKTGKRQANGVAGEPSVRHDGMTGIKVSAVSLYDCASAEQQGVLVTSGYVLSATILNAAPSVKPTAAAVGPAASAPVAVVAPVAAPIPSMPGQTDVAGVRLGMSPEEVRVVLRSKNLSEYFEATDSLRHPKASAGVMDSGGAGRFVNVIEAWTPTGSAESFQVLFTPVPGQERVMAVIHTIAYAASDGPSARALRAALVRKYGGSVAARDLPAAPTWRLLNGGNVAVDDACDRRRIFGGIGVPELLPASQVNVALKTTPDEFRYQIERCGIAIVTEDQMTVTVGAEEARVSRFTVTAYSPEIAFEGSTSASQWMQAGTEKPKSVGGAAGEVPPL